MPTLRFRLFPHQLNHRHLHQLVHTANSVKVVEEIPHSGGLRDVAEGDKGVALACRVGFLLVSPMSLSALLTQSCKCRHMIPVQDAVERHLLRYLQTRLNRQVTCTGKGHTAARNVSNNSGASGIIDSWSW